MLANSRLKLAMSQTRPSGVRYRWGHFCSRRVHDRNFQRRSKEIRNPTGVRNVALSELKLSSGEHSRKNQFHLVRTSSSISCSPRPWPSTSHPGGDCGDVGECRDRFQYFYWRQPSARLLHKQVVADPDRFIAGLFGTPRGIRDLVGRRSDLR